MNRDEALSMTAATTITGDLVDDDITIALSGSCREVVAGFASLGVDLSVLPMNGDAPWRRRVGGDRDRPTNAAVLKRF